MMDCLPRIPKPGKNDLRNRATITALDMAAVIYMVNLGPKKHTFKDYAYLNLIPFLRSKLSNTVERIHSIWESYGLVSLSLKSGTRVKRGGTFAKRTHVGPSIQVPKGKAWQDFLKDSENKKQLFNILSDEFKEAAKDEAYHFFQPKETLS